MSIHRLKKTGTRNKPVHREYNLQVTIADYLRKRHPSVLFNSDIKGSVKLNVRQASRMKKLYCDDFAMPDLILLEPRKGKAGLALELKAESPFKKDGTLKKSEHLERQQMALARLIERGYAAFFVWDGGQAIRLIEEYLG